MSYPFQVSLVIPFYNEENRIPLMIKGLQQFNDKFKGSFEVLLVNDGSKDQSVAKIEAEALYQNLKEQGKAKIISLKGNSGKGGALKKGVAEAQGQHILTLDADMATDPMTIDQWRNSLGGEFRDDQIWIGSRPHKDSKLQEKPLRKFIGIVFNAIIRLFTGVHIQDTQCGFKLYPHQIGKMIFEQLRVKGWAHDVEVLRRADLLGVEIKELPVTWEAVDESKISVVSDSIKMFLQTWHIAIGLFLYWGFIVPVKNFGGKAFGYIATKKYPEYGTYRKEAMYRFAFIIFTLSILFIMPYLSKDYGISGDEWIQNDYGQKIYNYYFLGDDAVLSEEKRSQGYEKIKFYSGGFELLCAIVYNTIDADNIWRVRHFINSLFGVLAFVFTGLVAKQLTGSWRAAFFALVLVTLTPRLFGHSMNNPKDIPFAAASIFTLFYIMRFVKRLPNPAFRDMFFLTVGIALALNIRIGGLLLFGYLGLFSLVQIIILNYKKAFDWSTDFVRILKYGITMAVIAYFLGIISWPYALQAPLTNPLEALAKMTNYDTVLTVLFEGKEIKSDVLPWYYEIKWMAISNPIVILFGLALFFVLALKAYKKFGGLPIFMVFFAIIFPVVYAIYQESVVYDGWRHFLFVWPPVVVLSAAAWHLLMTNKQKAIKFGAAGLFVIGLFFPAKWMVMAHPNQNVYFNEAFGGLEEAYGNYETDYYMNSVKQAMDWLVENENLETVSDTTWIVSNCTKEVTEYKKLIDNPMLFTAYSAYRNRSTKYYNYAIFISRFTDLEVVRNNWPPEYLVLHNIEENGVVLATILKKENQDDYKGYQALTQGNAALALTYFKSYLKYDPKNEEVYQYVGDAYAALGNRDEALKAYNSCLELNKGHMASLEKMGRIFMEQQNFANALKVYQRMIKYNEMDIRGYYYGAIAYVNLGDAQSAIAYLNKSVEVQPSFKQGYLTLSNIYRQTGQEQLANQFAQKANALP